MRCSGPFLNIESISRTFAFLTDCRCAVRFVESSLGSIRPTFAQCSSRPWLLDSFHACPRGPSFPCLSVCQRLSSSHYCMSHKGSSQTPVECVLCPRKHPFQCHLRFSFCFTPAESLSPSFPAHRSIDQL